MTITIGVMAMSFELTGITQDSEFSLCIAIMAMPIIFASNLSSFIQTAVATSYFIELEVLESYNIHIFRPDLMLFW
jgi:hypothetical protein